MKIDIKSLLIGIVLGAGISIISPELTNSNNETGRYVKYEQKEQLGIYESFKILDTKTGDRYYWEWESRSWNRRSIDGLDFRFGDGKWKKSEL